METAVLIAVIGVLVAIGALSINPFATAAMEQALAPAHARPLLTPGPRGRNLTSQANGWGMRNANPVFMASWTTIPIKQTATGGTSASGS